MAAEGGGPVRARGLVVTLAIVGALCLATLGTFAGNWAWSAFSASRQAAAADAASAATAAFALTPQGRAQAAVRRQMHDPGSAVFRNEFAAKSVPGTWCGEVNGRNLMGGMVGFARFVVDLQEHAELADLDEAQIEPVRDAGAFNQRYLALCR